eukprot:15466938-Alexandrium_andersonii.AAC.1
MGLDDAYPQRWHMFQHMCGLLGIVSTLSSLQAGREQQSRHSMSCTAIAIKFTCVQTQRQLRHAQQHLSRHPSAGPCVP